MKLPTLIKRDPVAALAAARAKLTDIEAELVKLDAARAAALVGSDEISDVQEIDDRRAGATRNAAVLKDRIGALALAIRVQRAEQREKEFQAGLAIVAERLKARVELARKLDGTLREFEDV